MAALVKEQMRVLTNTQVKSVIRPLPKYSPHYREESVPHTEIILYEDACEERHLEEQQNRQYVIAES